ncbi:MAG: hypothetical protein ACTSRK_16295 [Promethearchaeota archaeon]
MKSNIVKAAPDYLALSSHEFIHHFANLFETKESKMCFYYPTNTKLLGYSCRSLLEICMQFYSKKEIVVATTPLNHTSFRNIIEKYVKLKNIRIIPFNRNYNALGKLPVLEKCDVVIITHLFGQDLDLDSLIEFKKKHNCVILEDRVQGGTLYMKFSHEVVDISLYSMAMDKRPIALGGGVAYIKNQHQECIRMVERTVMTLPREKARDRLVELIKKIPTFLLYNRRTFLFLFINVVRLLHRYNKKISILRITQSYRKSNPGFSHNDYMLKPCPGLLKSMHENLFNYRKMENIYEKQHKKFMKYFSSHLTAYFFPWYRKTGALTPYNTILIEDHLVLPFLDFFNHHHISVIANPTYKMFNITYDSIAKDQKFNDGIVYLPSHANMNEEEMEYLSIRIREFYRKYVLPLKRPLMPELIKEIR